jgi:LacI family transcriptional regulator
MILANCYAKDASVPAVVPDEVQGGRLATETLLAKGHRRIGFLDASPTAALPPATVPPATAAKGRLEGYRSALKAAGIEYDDTLVVQAEPVQEGGYVGARELLERDERPSALFCFNDRTAMGAYAAIGDMGLSIPDDVAVIGFDNQEILASHSRPPLTTVALPHYEMGYRALERLLTLMHDEGADGGIEAIECPLVVRDSV